MVKNLSLQFLLAVGLVTNAMAQVEQSSNPEFSAAAQEISKRLDDSVKDLDGLRSKITSERVPLIAERGKLQAELAKLRALYQEKSRQVDAKSLDLSRLRESIKAKKKQSSYLSNLFVQYLREFESGLHIIEEARYGEVIEKAKLASENDRLSDGEVFAAQTSLLSASLDRLHDAAGGVIFEGSAVDDKGIVRTGEFALVGPTAIFRSIDGKHVGTAEQRLNSAQPATVSFPQSADSEAASSLIMAKSGQLPFDPTLGDAQKIASTEETLLEHVKKGGPVMIPIFAMAGLASLIALFKWATMVFVRHPSKRRIGSLLELVGRRDYVEANAQAARLSGPVGAMLAAGVEHIEEPRDLIEEVMFEKVLVTRLRLQKLLPFIAICAASAPLLGLLGTVTGIINTFKMITVFGSGDVKSLSGGISEALITTKFGLIVAIPSLLIHAFLSRKVRGILGHMETAAVSFVNQVRRTPDEQSKVSA